MKQSVMVIKSILNNFLESRYNFIFLNTVMGLAAFAVLFIGIIGFIDENIANGMVHVVFSLLSLLFIMHVKERTEGLEALNCKLVEEKESFRQISQTDKLTGLCNRHKLEEVFEYERRQSNRYKSELSLVMMDIDFFKEINDTHGHNKGDVFLKDVSRELKEMFRETDVVGRWGGEEFLILLPKTSIEDAYAIVERVRKHIEKKMFKHIGHKTASFGVTKTNEGDTLDTAIARADRALYDVKHSGRNKVKIAS